MSSGAAKAVDIGSIQKKIERLKAKYLQCDQKRLNIEKLALNLARGISSIDENKIKDAKVQITITELKSQAQSIENIISDVPTMNQSSDNIDLSNAVISADPTIAKKLKEKDELISRLRVEIQNLRNGDVSTLNRASKAGKTMDDLLDGYALKLELTQTKDQLEQHNYQKEELIRELLEKREQLRDYKALSTDREELRNEVKSLQLMKSQTDELLGKLSEENKKLRAELKSLRNKIDSGSTDVALLSQKYEDLFNRYKSTKQKLKEERTKAAKAQNLIAEHQSKLKTVRLDFDANNMKTELLIDEITQLKLQLANKENEVLEIQERTEKSMRKAASMQSTYKLLASENDALQQQLADARREKQLADQQIIKLRVDFNGAQNKISEREVEAEKAKEEAAEAKQRAQQASIRCSKYINATRELKSLVEEKEAAMADIKRKLGEQELQTRKREEQLQTLKETNEDLLDIKAEKERIERKFLQLQMENNNNLQKVGVLQKSLEQQQQTAQKLQNEVSNARKSHSMALAEVDSIKFDKAQTANRYEARIAKLEKEINDLNNTVEKKDKKMAEVRAEAEEQIAYNKQYNEKQLANIREDADKQIKQIKTDAEREVQSVRNEAAKQIALIKADSNQHIAEIEEKIRENDKNAKTQLINMEMEHKERVAKLDNRNSQLNKMIDDNVRKVAELSMENAKLKTFRSDVLKVLPQGNREDVVGDIRELQEARNGALNIIKSMKQEMKRSRDQNADILKTMHLDKLDENASPVAMLTSITAALSEANKQNARLKRDLNSANARSDVLLQSVQQLVPASSIEEIPRNVASTINDLKNELQISKKRVERLNDAIEKTRPYIQFDTPESLAVAAAKMNTNLQETKNTLQNTENEYNTMKHGLQNIIGTNNPQEIPRVVAELSEKQRKTEQSLNKTQKELQNTAEQLQNTTKDLQQTRSTLNNLQEDISNIVSVDGVQAIPLLVQNMKYENARINELISDAATSLGCDEAQLPNKVKSTLSKLEQSEKNNAEAEQRIAKFNKALGAYSDDAVISTIEELKEKAATLTRISSQLNSIGSDVTPEKAPMELKKTMDKLNEQRRVHDTLTNNLATTLGITDMNDIERALPAMVKNLIKDKANLDEALNESKIAHKDHVERHNALMNQLRKIEDFEKEDDLVEKLKYLSDANKEAIDVVSTLVAIVTRKNPGDVQIKFPLGAQVTAVITGAFRESLKKYDALKAEADELMERAQGLGFIGGTLCDALDFYTDINVKTKAQEMLEETVSKLRQVREESAKEREVFEGRLATANQKLTELRNQKTSQIDAALQRQSELVAVVDDREKEIRQLKNQVETLLRLKEELVRFAEKGASFDRDTLVSNLSASERRRLNL